MRLRAKIPLVELVPLGKFELRQDFVDTVSKALISWHLQNPQVLTRTVVVPYPKSQRDYETT